MAAARRTISLYYDVVSPYSWLAFETLQRYQTKWNVNLDLRPSFLGGVMQATENVPPGTNRQKAKFMVRDLQNRSVDFDLPVASIPPNFPVLTLGPMRLLSFARHNPQFENHVPALSRAFWDTIWVKHLDPTDEAVVTEVCEKVVGKEACMELLKGGMQKESKDKLKAETETAVKKGAFGFPAIFTEGPDGKEDMYFGVDQIPYMCHRCQLPWDGPLPAQSSKL